MVGADMMERITDLFGLEHKPIRGVRKDIIGEVVFASMWEVLMQRDDGSDDYAIEGVLTVFPRVIEQRHATVLASVVCWLGTNCGHSFLEQAKTISAKLHERTEEQYVIAWAIENLRRGYINSGDRAIEAILATEYRGWRCVRPELSADDLEVVELLMHWLGSRSGQDFLQNCNAEINRMHIANRDKQLAEWKRKQQPEVA
jgi:hypothetical protein